MQLSAREEGLRWLEQAEADRHGAQLLLDGGSYHLACFVAQQIAEKAIKAFLYAQGEESVAGHAVERLCRWAAQYDPSAMTLRVTVSPLDGLYIPTRYPNGLPDGVPAHVYTRDVAEDALRRADAALDWVRARICPGPNVPSQVSYK